MSRATDFQNFKMYPKCSRILANLLSSTSGVVPGVYFLAGGINQAPGKIPHSPVYDTLSHKISMRLHKRSDINKQFKNACSKRII